MKSVLAFIVVALSAAVIFTGCESRPEKNTRVYGMGAHISEEVQSDVEISETEDEMSEAVSEESEEAAEEEGSEEVSEEPKEIDTHVYTGDELTDELIREKLIGYWEFDDFGYLGGYRFHESGFLQLVLERKVNQTGIFMVKFNGIYFSLDSKTWDEDVLVVKSVSDTEIVGTFGDNELTIHRADESLVEENSGYSAEEGGGYGETIDAATEVDRGISAS